MHTIKALISMIVLKVQHVIKSEVGNSLKKIFVKFLHIHNKVMYKARWFTNLNKFSCDVMK